MPSCAVTPITDDSCVGDVLPVLDIGGFAVKEGPRVSSGPLMSTSSPLA
jgi:hypothetical protein